MCACRNFQSELNKLRSFVRSFVPWLVVSVQVLLRFLDNKSRWLLGARSATELTYLLACLLDSCVHRAICCCFCCLETSPYFQVLFRFCLSRESKSVFFLFPNCKRAYFASYYIPEDEDRQTDRQAFFHSFLLLSVSRYLRIFSVFLYRTTRWTT